MSVTINHQTNSVEPSSGNLLIGGSGNVGIGTSSPTVLLDLESASPIIRLTDSDATGTPECQVSGAGGDLIFDADRDNEKGSSLIKFNVDGSERMRIDSSGNLMVGKTSNNYLTDGFQSAGSSGDTGVTGNGIAPFFVNRRTSDGTLVNFYKNGSPVGSIGVYSSNIFIGTSDTGLSYNASGDWVGPCNPSTLTNRDNAIDLGASTVRFDDVYATNGTIQTSDRNEKQDIEALSDAEQRVAVACKGLMRKFRWRDAVAEKGDEARTHFGIIAQDLQAAFAAGGLDAGDYAMFISTTWWETQTEVPAVEAVAEVLDEDGNVVTEAVEAVDAYTRTDTYDTQEEAPEGATERTRLGVRYSELLAFIIAAI